jgi:hypothetical protein
MILLQLGLDDPDWAEGHLASLRAPRYTTTIKLTLGNEAGFTENGSSDELLAHNAMPDPLQESSIGIADSSATFFWPRRLLDWSAAV